MAVFQGELGTSEGYFNIAPVTSGAPGIRDEVLEGKVFGLGGEGVKAALITEGSFGFGKFNGSKKIYILVENVPKNIAMKMLIRSMAPKVIVADEIGAKEDKSVLKIG